MGVKTIKTYAERMRSEGVSRAMMVTIANITPFARQCLQEMHQKYYIETVRLPTQHVNPPALNTSAYRITLTQGDLQDIDD